jgi:hypothetical protein
LGEGGGEAARRGTATTLPVGGRATASFVFDDDPARVQRDKLHRVKGTVAGVTTVYIINSLEWSNSTGTKYFYAGNVRVAMRTGGRCYTTGE